MGISFCFVKSNNENENLTIVDDKIAEFLGEKPDTEFAKYVDAISDVGVGILMKCGGSFVTEKIFNAWLKLIKESRPELYKNFTECHNGKMVECSRKFLYQDYSFKAWR